MPTVDEILRDRKRRRDAAQRLPPIGKPPKPKPEVPNFWGLLGAGLEAGDRLLRGKKVTKASMRDALRARTAAEAMGPRWRPYAPTGHAYSMRPGRPFGAQQVPARSGMRESPSLFSRSERVILPQRAVPGGTVMNPVLRPVPQRARTSALPGGAPLSQVPMDAVHRWSGNSNRGTGPIGMTASRDLVSRAVAPRAGAVSLVSRRRVVGGMDRTNPIYTTSRGVLAGATRYR